MSDREFLVEANTQDALKFYITDTGMSLTDAIRKFYASEVFEKLQDFTTSLYLESPAYIYELYKNELDNGKIVQDEI